MVGMKKPISVASLASLRFFQYAIPNSIADNGMGDVLLWILHAPSNLFFFCLTAATPAVILSVVFNAFLPVFPHVAPCAFLAFSEDAALHSWMAIELGHWFSIATFKALFHAAMIR